ncbi:MAG TPA: ankyrin repeat domain-containing protein [Candidatus Paceibacterota bacterium]|nr:ankyrin repeat domain-containing protein [Candidatus Paceibacterota bacterium]
MGIIAMIIRENIEFQRGRDPKSTIGIGMREVIANEMAKQNRGWTYENDQNALDWAILYGNPEHTIWLIENGEGFILKAPKPGELRTDPVELAAKHGYLDIVELLLAKGFRTTYKSIDAILSDICWSDRGETYFKIAELILKTHKFSPYRLQKILEFALRNKKSVDDSTRKNTLIGKLIVIIAEYLEEASKGLKESADFERGKTPQEVLEIGLRYKKDLKKGDIFLVWNKNIKGWERMEALKNATEEFYTTYETPDLFVNAKKEKGSWLLEASCIWNPEKSRWEFLNQLKIKESLDFERGKDPKEILGLGIEQQIENFLKSVDQSTSNLDHKLKICARYGKVPFVEYLIKQGADPRAQGDIALTMAINRNDTEMVKALLKSGAKWGSRYISKSRLKKISPEVKHLLAKYEKPIGESLDFERGKNVMDTLKLGIRSSLQSRKMGFSIEPSRMTSAILRIWNDISKALEVESPDDVFFLGRSDSSSITRFPAIPKDILENISPYIFTDEAIKKSVIFDMGTGNKYQVYQTPWGKILKEMVWGNTENYYVNYETAKELGLYKYPILNESLDFERGMDPKRALKEFLIFRKRKLLGESYQFRRETEPYRAINVGTDRLLKKGDPLDVHYKGKVLKCTAMDDEEIDDRSGRRFIDFVDEDGGICWAVRSTKTGNWIVPSAGKDEMLESYRFERGIDPKKALDIGMNIFQADGLGFYTKNVGFSFDEEYAELILQKMGSEIHGSLLYGDVLVNKLIPPEGVQSYSINYLIRGPGEYDYVRYKGKLYPIHNPKNRLSSIKESLDFQRGKDPKEALGIGIEVQYQKIIDRVSQENTQNNYFKPVHKGVFKGIPYIIFQDTVVGSEKPWGESSFVGVFLKEDTIEDTSWSHSIEESIKLVKNKISEGILFPQLSAYNESVHFERGKDPKSSMGIGVYQKIRDGIEFIINHPHINDANYERDTMYGGADFMIETILGRKDIKRLVKKTFGDILIPMGAMEYTWKTFRVKPDLIDTFEQAWNDVLESL